MRIRVGRLIGYILALAVTAAMVAVFGGTFLFIMLMMEIVALPIDIITSMLLLRKSELLVSLGTDHTQKGDLVLIGYNLRAGMAFSSYEAAITLTIRNTFYGTSGQTQIAIPVNHEGEMHYVPLRFSLLGYYEITADHVMIRDVLGLADLKKTVDKSVGVTVFPKGDRDMRSYELHPSGGMTEAEETDRRGNDFSDVSEIREYVPGDRPRDIHWKLSAKRDELMIKQREAMSDEQLIVVVEFTEILEENDEVVSEAYSLIKELVRSNVNTQLMWWSAADEDFRRKRFQDQGDVDEAFSEMFGERAEMTEDIDRLMRSVHPEITGYIRVYSSDGQVKEAVVDGSR